MSNKRNQRGAVKSRGSFTAEARRAAGEHLRRHAAWHAPAASPVALFFFAHLLTLAAFALMKSGVLQQDQLDHKSLVIWSVYGFLPLLLCSYLCFFVVARPVAGFLARRFPDWTAGQLDLASGAAYGAAVAVALCLLLQPTAWLNAGLVLLVGIASGLGNWFLYRKLTADAACPIEPSPQERP